MAMDCKFQLDRDRCGDLLGCAEKEKEYPLSFEQCTTIAGKIISLGFLVEHEKRIH